MNLRLLNLVFIILFFWRPFMAQSDVRAIRTYLSFSYPVDPASVKTLVDMDLTYALTTTLVDWDNAHNLTEGLAERQTSTNDKELIFKLKPTAIWSDGSPITAIQVIRSFDHAKQLHDEAMKGLFELVDSLVAKDEKTIVFKLNRSVVQSQILHKLTEPVYGVVFIGTDGKEDLQKTSGPFILSSSSAAELNLKVNHHWYGHQKGMPDEITIRQPSVAKSSDKDGFSDDPWPNLMTTSSLMSEKSIQGFKSKNYSIWSRNLDRLFFFSPSKKHHNEEGQKLLQAISKKLDRNKLLSGLGGYHLTNQFFPPGYPIFDSELKNDSTSVQVPEKFKNKPLEILGADGRVSAILLSNLKIAIKEALGVEPKVILVPLNKFESTRVAGQFDFAFIPVAVNDPNVEGPVSFIFGLNPPLIPNSSGLNGDFKSRVMSARTLDQTVRNTEYRKVFTQATHDGCVLPLFHFSSIVVARGGIDLSSVPSADETVAFSKIRFK